MAYAIARLKKLKRSNLTEEAEGQGAGSRGSNPCTEAVKRSGTWVSSPALLGRSRLVGVQAPSNLPPCPPLPCLL